MTSDSGNAQDPGLRTAACVPCSGDPATSEQSVLRDAFIPHSFFMHASSAREPPSIVADVVQAGGGIYIDGGGNTSPVGVRASPQCSAGGLLYVPAHNSART